MKIRRPALLAGTVALAMLPAMGLTTSAEAVTKPKPKAKVKVAKAAPDPAQLLALVLSCFPPNIQADVGRMMAGDVFGGLQALLTDASKLTPEQLNEIVAKLQKILSQLPLPQQQLVKSKIKGGLTKAEAAQILLAVTR